MKNASSLKSKPETPKTPGGISKSLLTPCRRVGLSRNWKKSVTSPFNSPLASSEVKEDTFKTRKRNLSPEETPKVENDEKTDSVGTPARKVDLPRRKKSKTLLNSITKTAEDDTLPEAPPENNNGTGDEEKNSNDFVMIAKTQPSNVITTPAQESIGKDKLIEDIVSEVSTPVQLKTKSKKKISPKSNTKVFKTENNKKDTTTTTKPINEVVIEKEKIENSNMLKITEDKTIKMDTKDKYSDEIKSTTKEKKENSPNNLTKECIVVIQKKIFKNHFQNTLATTKNGDQQKSQALFNDSDSDEVPLNCLNKPKNDVVETITIDDDDFTPSKHTLKKTSSNKKKLSPKPKVNAKETIKTKINVLVPSQSSIDDDDEFFEKKRTIVVRKTYDKVIKPLKARSTGSITQKDIEDLKARIELKKKMLLAKSMTDTKELRELIKKWQKGCQDALMELMNLMKDKCPEQNMEYSQILQTLKIPPNLVGYDSDNDCFVTPEDESIILSHIKE